MDFQSVTNNCSKHVLHSCHKSVACYGVGEKIQAMAFCIASSMPYVHCDMHTPCYSHRLNLHYISVFQINDNNPIIITKQLTSKNTLL